MGMFMNVYVIMAVLGLLSFVFIAEAVNPFKRHRVPVLRTRHRIGVLVGMLIGLSSLINLFAPTPSLIMQVKQSTITAFFLLLPVVLFMLFKQFYRRNRSESSREATASGAVKTGSETAITNSVAQATAKMPKPEPDLTTHRHSAAANTSSVIDHQPDTVELGNDTAEELKESFEALKHSADPIEPSVEADTDQLAESIDESAQPAADQVLPRAGRHLTDQAPTPDVDEIDIGNNMPSTARVAKDDQDAANSTFMSHTFPDDSVIADDLLDDNVVRHTVDDIDHDAAVNESVDRVLDASDEVKEHSPVNESWQPETAAAAEPVDDIQQLQTAMDDVTNQADAIQESIVKIQDLNAEEQHSREQLRNAQIAYDNAQRLQIEQQRKQIQSSETRLINELKQRNDAEKELARQRQTVVDMQVRVKDLEAELTERQRVFADQVSSLKKTREMARHAAHLARRAALAQQRARTQALQERAAREKLEVSAKKAVDIARNAISKLAEEERKNKNMTH